jgi:predicted nuclease of predicted toxin-antitoxin system
MWVLFDNGTPRTLARFLIGEHTVTEARAHGWAELENGELLAKAEAAGFDVIVTTDKNIGYQQNMSGRRIAIVVAAVAAASAGSYVLVEKPYESFD